MQRVLQERSAYPAGGISRFSRTIRTVRWVELAGVVFGEGVRAAMRETSGYAHEPWTVLIMAVLMVVYNLWAMASGRIWLVDRSSPAGIGVDTTFITGVLMVTGGTDSWFLGLYAVLIVCVAVRYGLKGALPAAVACASLGALSEYVDKPKAPDLVIGVVSHVTYLFLLAWVTGEVTEAFRFEMDKRAQSERKRERMESDLAAAQQVQNSLLPRSLPDVAGLEVGVKYSPAGAVGGDIYDFLSHSRDEVGFVVADVSGHSLPAALLVAAAKSALHDAATFPPERLASLVNARMVRDAASDQFLTLVYARINAGTGRVRIISAGHPPPVLFRPGLPPHPLDADGMVLGVSPDATWHERIHQLEPGDTLALYSDGLMERRNLEGNYASLDDWLAALSAMSLTGSAQNIADAIWELSETLGERTDDASLIVVRFTGYQPPVEATLGSWV